MIFNPFSGVPLNPKSHTRGWAKVWADLLQMPIATKDSKLTECQTLALDHGVNFGGSMNLFSGVTEEMIDTLTELVMFDGQLISLDIPMPNYAEQLEKRIGQATCHPALKDLLPALKERLSNYSTISMVDLKTEYVAIGDSHSTAFSRPGSSVLRSNGATLYGAIKNRTVQAQLDSLKHDPKRVTLVYGSIDIRHHLCRQNDPKAALIDLCKAYADLVKEIQSDYLVEVEVAAPVPVEFEGRRLPKTGYYKDTPYFGPIGLRQALTEQFKLEMALVHGIEVVSPPAQWYTMDPETYAKTYMEMGGSVHIAPLHYRRYFDWTNHV